MKWHIPTRTKNNIWEKNILGLLEQRDYGWFFPLCLLLSSTTNKNSGKMHCLVSIPNLDLGITGRSQSPMQWSQHSMADPKAHMKWLRGPTGALRWGTFCGLRLGANSAMHLAHRKSLLMFSFSFILQRSVRTHVLLGDIFIWQSWHCEEFTRKK